MSAIADNVYAFFWTAVMTGWVWVHHVHPATVFVAGIAVWFVAERTMGQVRGFAGKAAVIVAVALVVHAVGAGVGAVLEGSIEIPAFGKATSHQNEDFFKN